jgi:hypothetical protein
MSGLPHPIAMQQHLKQNAQELNAYLKDLQHWSSEVKTKDDALKTGKMTLTKTPLEHRPIRGAAAQPVLLPSSASADQQRFAAEKQLGNDAFAAGKYEQAVTHYSQCMLLQPSDAISPSNRAQALLKLKRFHEAESDATLALELDPKHVKSLFRRAQARKELRKYAGAVQDCEAIAKLDSANKPAQALLKESQTLLQKQQAAKAAASQPIVTAKPVTAMAAPTSALPAGRRMVIQEEDDDSEEEAAVPIKKATTIPAAAAPASTATSTPANAAAFTPVKATPAASSASSSSPAAAAAAPVSPSSAAAGAFRVPKTTYDFDSTFRTIRSNPQQIAEYFRLITDWKSYAVLLKTAMDGNLLKSLALTLTQHLHNELPLSFTILRGLTTVPRFNVARMMLDAGDKKIYTQLLQSMVKAPEAAGATEADVKQVAKEFGVQL